MSSLLGAFVLSNSQLIVNKIIRELNEFYNSTIYYEDTDSLYIENYYWDVSDEASLFGKNYCQGKNDYRTGGIFYGLFLAPKTKCILTVDEYGIIQQKMTFKGFNDSKRLLDQS